MARLRRTGDEFCPQEALPLKPCRDVAYHSAIADLFIQPPEGCAYDLPDGRIAILRAPLPHGLSALWTLAAGVQAGEIRKGRFLPAHSLFLAAPLTDACLPRFLAGEAVPCPEDWRGYIPVCAGGFPIGFGKAVEGTLKNHVPKGLRVV